MPNWNGFILCLPGDAAFVSHGIGDKVQGSFFNVHQLHEEAQTDETLYSLHGP